ncbi:hypothetical protein [Tahibacter caeni]|uniref:hypothetical protein n=1 Tax=Tahibacter caeni TaxID=1453545 RepID=UPI0021489415|nr:hypothetical protein [Tahibacter caeni]
MATIWKELLFLHGHFGRPEDLLDEMPVPAAVADAPRDVPAPREAALDADALACGGCH